MPLPKVSPRLQSATSTAPASSACEPRWRPAPEFCERWLPLWRVLLHNQNESELLKTRIGLMRDAVWARLTLMYRVELATLAEADRRKILIALEQVTDFESWGRMRERHGLSVADAIDAWITAIDRLLPPTPGPR